MINNEYRPIHDIRASDDQLESLHTVTQASLTEIGSYDRAIITDEDLRFYGFPPTGEAYDSLPIMNAPPGRTVELSPELVHRVAPHAAALLEVYGIVAIEQDLPYIDYDGGDDSSHGPVAAESHFFIYRKGKAPIEYALQDSLGPSGPVEGWCSAPVYVYGSEADYDIRLRECTALQEVVTGWAALVRKGGACSADGRVWRLPEAQSKRRIHKRPRRRP